MIRDATGHTFAGGPAPQRVISLVPSLTETLFDLGAGQTVVGITDYCIFPPGLEVPRLGGTKNPRIDDIRSLHPDLVHMNLEENLQRDGERIEAFAPLFVSEPKRVEDVAQLIRDLGEIHDRRAEAAVMLRDLTDALDMVRDIRPFTFACPIWKAPWMWCGGDTYVSSLITSAGGTNVLGDRARYPTVPLNEVSTLSPAVIFLPDEPWLFTEGEREILQRSMDATIIGPFPGHLFTWHGSRTILGLRFLAEALRSRS